MGLNTGAYLDAAESAFARLGVFERINMHEPENAPATGITASLWLGPIRPLAPRSGLDVTSVLVVLYARLQTSLIQQPQNGVDRQLAQAVDAVINAITGDFDLGGAVDEVDLFGRYGVPMQANPGYLRQDDGPVYRVMQIDIPMVINDVWTQVK